VLCAAATTADLPLPPPPHRRHAAANVTLALVDCYISVQYLCNTLMKIKY
jgi:hypothetical protein